jgi:hypothetical protein
MVGLRTLALTTAVLLPTSFAVAQQTRSGGQKYYFCQLPVKAAHSTNPTTYVSPVFASDGDRMAISKAWDKYILGKYAPEQLSQLESGYVPPHCSPGTQGGLQDIHDRAIKGSAVEVAWTYTPEPAPSSPVAASGAPEVAPGAMSAEVRQAIEAEAMTGAPSFCQNGGLTAVYPHAAGTTPQYDCACFAQKVHDYRMREYEQVGEKILVIMSPGTLRKGLDPQLVSLISPRGNPKLDFKSCALP